MTIGLATAFLGGVAALLSPCAAMLLPGFFALAFGARVSTLLARIGVFFLGMCLTLVPMGFAAGRLGAWLLGHRPLVAMVGGALLVVMGLLTMAGLSIPVPGLHSSGGTSPLAVLALGAVYGLAGACTGPLLGAVLTVATLSGSSLHGALLLVVFAAGMVLPLALLALCWDGARVAERFQPRQLRLGPVSTTVWGLVAGGLLVFLGVLFFNTEATGSLGGLLDASEQLALESWLWERTAGVPDVVALGLLALAVGALVWWAMTRSDITDASEPPSR